MLDQLIQALPSGAAEAVTTMGVTGLLAHIRRARGKNSTLEEQVLAIDSGASPARPIEQIRDEVLEVLDATGVISQHAGSSSVQQAAGAHSTLINVQGGAHHYGGQDPHTPSE
jgi:hypothetical protein